MQTSKRGLALIESFEGYSATQYDDGTGVMTIGYGTTSADVSPLPTFMSRGEAEWFLAHQLHVKYEPAVNALGPVNQNQYDALVSFAYNLGPGSMAWDVGRLTRAHRFQEAADAMLAYDHAGGQRMLGLTRRRQAERALYLTPWVAPFDKYLVFPTSPVKIGGRTINERDAVKTYDALNAHPWANRAKLGPLRHDLAFLRDRIRVVAGLPGHGGWGVNGRKTRFEALARRAPARISPSTR